MDVKIEDSFVKKEKYPTVSERYFSKYHYVPQGINKDQTHCIMVHTNRLCLITLAESHPVLRDNKTITKIDFQVTQKLNRLENNVKGKNMRGAQAIQPSSRLCFIECADNTRYGIYGCLNGKLVEINDNLTKDYELLARRPQAEGFIAIIRPNSKCIDEQIEKFVLSAAAMRDDDSSEGILDD